MFPMASEPVVHLVDVATPGGMRAMMVRLADVGYCTLTHAVPESLEAAALKAAVELFGRSDRDKRRYLAPLETEPGFFPYGAAHALDTGVPNLLESWSIGVAPPTRFPSEPREAFAAIVALLDLLSSLSSDILTAMDHGLEASGKLRAMYVPRRCDLFALHYPRALLGVAPDARRQSIHIDSSIITLAPRATTTGLLAVDTSGRLVDISPRRGEVVVLAGSVLDHVTGARIRGCQHTVETPPSSAVGCDRTAFVYFAAPDPRAVLHPLVDAEVPVSPLQVHEHDRAYRAHVFPRHGTQDGAPP
jgi:hypothetical protein